MNLSQNHLRVDRLERECAASATQAMVLAAALSVLTVLVGLAAMLA